MTEADVLRHAREYIVENFLYMRRNKTIGDEDSLLRTGVVSSLGMMEVVAWVEQTFGVTVDPAEITEQNFDSLKSIARFVHAKRAAAPA
jgi:acyl carrier protein